MAVKLLAVKSKQPDEVLDYDVSFTEWFANRSDLPQSIQVVAEAGLDLVDSILSGTVVKVIVGGGTSGASYKVTVLLTTTTGMIKEVDFRVKVKEV